MSDPILVKFGTPTPIRFREYDARCPQIDLDLEARIAGAAAVSAYDEQRYTDAAAVMAEIRAAALPALAECLRNWPEGKSVWNNRTKAVLADTLDQCFMARGISAKTEITSFSLTSESAELFQGVMAAENERMRNMYADLADMIDVSLRNEGQPPLEHGMKPPSIDGGMMIGVDTAPGMRFVAQEIRNAPTDKFCRLCGTKRAAQAKFCTECGAAFV